MDRIAFEKIRQYMIDSMKDAAHDVLHVYRVLNQAMVIVQSHPEADRDILIASCLLHDVGRQAQFRDPSLCHAVEGGKMAYAFLRGLGWEEARCAHVRECVTTHRFRANNPPKTIEAKILFDADKLDATGALGIARSLIYQGQTGTPLYTVDTDNHLQDGISPDVPDSFLREYHFKLIKLYDRFYTPEAREIGQKRKQSMEDFYRELLQEIDLFDIDEIFDI